MGAMGGGWGTKGEKVMHVQTPTMPDDLREALKDLDGAIATLGGMPVDYQRRAFFFIEQGSAHTRGFRISNLVEVVKFFHQHSED
jgi:hypothetical protein